jgi:glycyl-tRNA synthetase
MTSSARRMGSRLTLHVSLVLFAIMSSRDDTCDLELSAVQNRTMTLRCVFFALLFKERRVLNVFFRERDTTDQLIGAIDDVVHIVVALVEGEMDWAEACRRLPKYDGVQAV